MRLGLNKCRIPDYLPECPESRSCRMCNRRLAPGVMHVEIPQDPNTCWELFVSVSTEMGVPTPHAEFGARFVD